MPPNEQEEFEFRARAEKEASGSVPPPKENSIGAPQQEGFLDKARGGVETVGALLSGATTGALGYAGSLLGQAAGQAVAGKLPKIGYPSGDEVAREAAGKLTLEPHSQSGKSQLEAVGKALDASKLQGLGPTGAAAVSAMPAKAALSTGKAAISKGAQKVGSMTPKLAPDTKALAQKAQAMGIPLRPDQLSGNPLLRMAGEASEKVPLSGSKAPQRREAFNKAIMKTIGADEKTGKLTPDVFDKAMTASGEKIGEIAGKASIPLDTDLLGKMDAYAQRATKFETDSVAKILTNYIEEFKSKAENGIIPGEAYRKLNSEIGRKVRSTQDGDLKHALGEFQDAMHEALTKNLSGEDLQAFQQARQQYAIAKAVEPLVAKSETGDISPAALMQAVTASKDKKAAMARGRGGDIGDIAKIGQRFIKEPKSSGTAERNLVYGALGGGAAAMNPALGAVIYGGANLYNRAAPWLSRKMTGADKAMKAIGADGK